MTDVPENFDDVPIQVIELNHPATAAVFTETDGEVVHVYYNLGSLVHNIHETAVQPRAMYAELTNSHDDKMRVEGAVFVLESIRMAGLDLIQQATAKRDAAVGLPSAADLAAMFDASPDE